MDAAPAGTILVGGTDWPRIRQAITLPFLHQLAPLFEQVTSAISGFDLVTDHMRQCHLGDLTREVGLLGCPVSKSRTEAVDRQIFPSHSAEQFNDRHVGEGLPYPLAREHVISHAHLL